MAGDSSADDAPDTTVGLTAYRWNLQDTDSGVYTLSRKPLVGDHAYVSTNGIYTKGTTVSSFDESADFIELKYFDAQHWYYEEPYPNFFNPDGETVQADPAYIRLYGEETPSFTDADTFYDIGFNHYVYANLPEIGDYVYGYDSSLAAYKKIGTVDHLADISQGDKETFDVIFLYDEDEDTEYLSGAISIFDAPISTQPPVLTSDLKSDPAYIRLNGEGGGN